MMGEYFGLDVMVIQIVGCKGWDGFVFVLVWQLLVWCLIFVVGILKMGVILEQMDGWQ